MGLIDLATKFPRYAKVIGMGFKSGRMMNTADDLAAQATRLRVPTVPYANASPSNLVQAANLENSAARLTAETDRLSATAKRYSQFQRFDIGEARDSYRTAQSFGKFVNPALVGAENVVAPAARLAGGALMHPAGQMGLFLGAPMLLMGGGGEQQPQESYQEMGSYATSMTPPASYQDAYAPSYGMPATPQLDEEQIRKARRRAEEQAALNQFYAQALTQYQPYN